MKNTMLQLWLDRGLLRRSSAGALTLSGGPPCIALPSALGETVWVPSSIEKHAVEEYPLKQFPRRPVLIETETHAQKTVAKLLRRAAKHSERLFGFDLEWRPTFEAGEPQNPPAVLQVATCKKVYVFKLTSFYGPRHLSGPERVRYAIDILRPFLEEPRLFKAGVGITRDESVLREWCHDLQCRSMLDLTPIAQKLGFRTTSLLNLSCLLLGHRISKSETLSDWATPKLSTAQLVYAATDAWVSLKIAQKLVDVQSLQAQ